MAGLAHRASPAMTKYIRKRAKPRGNPAALSYLRKVVYMRKFKKLVLILCIIFTASLLFSTTALAAGSGDVAGAIEGTWKDASGQIKTVVNKVVFPAIDLILAVFFFAKLGTAYFDYRKHGQFEWAAPAILFACLVLTLTAPTYIWTILGM
jgi:hypothetical protein